MHAITVRNPWAYAIAHGIKRIENRSWRPPVHLLDPGAWLAIHAGAEIDPQARKPPHQVTLGTVGYGIKVKSWTCPIPPSEMPSSAVVAVVRVIGIHDDKGKHTPPSVINPTYTARDEEAWERISDIKYFGRNGEVPWRTDHRYGWLLSDVQRLAEPVSVHGRLGCWRLPEAVEVAVRA